MRTSIHIGTLRFYAHHGVLPQEQKVGNYFKVETTLYTDFSRALVTDELTEHSTTQKSVKSFLTKWPYPLAYLNTLQGESSTRFVLIIHK